MWYNKNMNNDEIINLIQRFCCMSENEMLTNILTEMYKIKKKIVMERTPDYIYIKGDLPVLLVAHIDTYFDMPAPQPQDFTAHNGMILRTKYDYNSHRNAGFDDRAGIAMIYYIIKHGYIPSILLCNQEEIGCWGAVEFIKNHTIKDCPFKFLIELDRSGEKDAVYYDCANESFKKFINDYGFEEASGSYTDIAVLAPMLQLAAVNLSVGYYKEHTEEELVCIPHWHSTAQKVCTILEDSTSTLLEPFPYSEETRLSCLLWNSPYYAY